MSLTIRKGEATPSAIIIFFSDTVFADSASKTLSATNPANYTVYDPNSADFDPPRPLAGLDPNLTITYDNFVRAIQISIPAKSGVPRFTVGDPVIVTLSNIAVTSDPGKDALGGKKSISLHVNGKGDEGEEITEAVEDAVAYPLLTEQVRFPAGGGAGTGMAAPSIVAMPLGQIVGQAITDVLGWKINATDPKGFVGALTQSFTLSDVEGHTEAKWTPRTYAVQTDLSGGITGAQASLYSRAKDALDQSLPLLDGLYPLDPEADPEDVTALRELARTQMS